MTGLAAYCSSITLLMQQRALCNGSESLGVYLCQFQGTHMVTSTFSESNDDCHSTPCQSHQQHNHRHISSQTQRSDRHNHIPTRPELLLHRTAFAYSTKELLVPLLSAKQADEEDANTVDGEQSSYAVELACEDLKDDECEAELTYGCAHVCALEGALSGTNFNEFGVCELDGASSVHTQVIVILSMAAFEDGEHVGMLLLLCNHRFILTASSSPTCKSWWYSIMITCGFGTTNNVYRRMAIE